MGVVLRWKWVRNPWFRAIHLIAIGIVVAESLAGIPCPLTVWERQLRKMAGQIGYHGRLRWLLGASVDFLSSRALGLHDGVRPVRRWRSLAAFVLAPPAWRLRVTTPAAARFGASTTETPRSGG